MSAKNQGRTGGKEGEGRTGGRGRKGGKRQSPPTPMFAACLPGLGPILAKEIKGLSGASEVEIAGNDGRSDIVRFVIADGSTAQNLRCAEDLYAIVSDVPQSRDLRQLASRLIGHSGLDRAEATYAQSNGHPLRKRATARVIARVTDERNFRRTELRFAVTREMEKIRPEWRYADPSDAELWVLQTGNKSFISGLRVTTKEFRQRGGRTSERQGALRPSVAASLVLLAGQSTGGILLDPCCGSGTICAEAEGSGWTSFGADLDADALKVAMNNGGCAGLTQSDARRLPFADGTIQSVVTNLPFGRQFVIEGGKREWFEAVLTEIGRVLVKEVEARAIVLVPRSPEFTSACETAGFRVKKRYDIDLLGTRTAAWELFR